MCKIVKSSRVQGFEREFFSFNSREVLDESEERVKLHGLPSFRYFSIAYIVYRGFTRQKRLKRMAEALRYLASISNSNS